MAARLLNVGCGQHLHPSWVNLDVYASAPGVIVHDIERGLPFPDASFDACYHSHVLEHLTRSAGEQLLRECHRVLRPGGIVRVVVPDLEGIARTYLASLADVARDEPGSEARYDWIVLELLDQMVRDTSGGDMGRALFNGEIDREFVRDRVGAEAERAWGTGATTAPRSGVLGMLRRATPRRLLTRALRGARRGSIAHAVREGLFRSSGEVHRWMYDRYSLARLLRRVGFDDVLPRRAGESAIPDFPAYELDVVGGRIRKPDSLFVEGVRPATPR